jgi:hypothetical protein
MDEMGFIPSPSGKAKCGEVGGKADGRKGIKYLSIAAFAETLPVLLHRSITRS